MLIPTMAIAADLTQRILSTLVKQLSSHTPTVVLGPSPEWDSREHEQTTHSQCQNHPSPCKVEVTCRDQYHHVALYL
eukprot:11887801-Ditylum_brightwellii.AAC.1